MMACVRGEEQMRLLTIAIIAGCLAWQSPAYARLRSETITPTNTVTSELTFQVSVEDPGKVTFSISVSPSRQIPLSTNLTSTLLLKDSDGLIAECPISEKQDGNRLTFSFAIHKKLLPESVLAISSRHDIQAKDAETGKAGGRISVGTVYYVKLAEFLKK
jgi:hypothetical protein